MGTRRRRRKSQGLGGVPGYLLVLILILLWLYQEFRPPPPLETGQVQAFFMPEEGPRAKAALLTLLAQAQERVEGAFYEFRDLEIARGLLEAKARGVKVEIYGESDYKADFRRYLVGAALGQTGDTPRVGLEALRQRIRPLSLDCEEIAGIPVCFDEREGFMHHKFLVVDRQLVFTGSTNLTWNAFARNNENSLLLPSPTLAQGYGREFQALFRGEKEGLGEAVSFRLEDKAFGLIEGTAYFSPKGGGRAREALLEALKEAKQEIWVAAFVLTDRGAVEALAEAQRRGVGVRVLLEERNLEDSREEDLLEAGIEVRKDPNPYTLHHKVMVIDREVVATGSYNFSVRAYQTNNENLLILKGPGLAQAYRKEVERLWQRGQPL